VSYTGDGQTEAVGDFPELLKQGERVGDLEVRERVAFAASRHPRTAAGCAPERGLLWLVVVDGRQPPHSNGMTLPELTSLFEALGATEALNSGDEPSIARPMRTASAQS
jgi:exopolysaccharide biosynthesis protein